MKQYLIRFFASAELFFLYFLAFVLPVYESPKTAALVLFSLFWFVHRIMNSDIHWRMPDSIEWALLAIITIGCISTGLNWPAEATSLSNSTKGIRDTVMWSAGFWLLYRGDYSLVTKTRIFYAIVFGTLYGLALGTWQVVNDQRVQLQFNSAGVVTQSAIYLGIVLVATWGCLWSKLDQFSRGENLFWWACLIVFSAALIVMGSRGGVLAVLFAGTIYIFRYRHTIRKILIPAIVIIATGIVTYFAAPKIFHHERMIAKIDAALSTAEHPNIRRSRDDVAIGDEIRFENWRIAIAHLKRGSQPFFGIGPRQFDKLKSTDYNFDPPLKYTYKKLEHAHNLFLTKWVEEGLLGLLAFLSLLVLFFNGIFFDRRDRVEQPWLWGAAMGALVVPITSGFFGSPWKHEFAILSMLLFGLYFSHYATAPDVSINGASKRT